MTGASRATRAAAAPEPVGGVLGGVLDGLGIREPVERSATALRWEAVVGPRIASVARARGLKGAKLFVEVDGAAWMTELSLMRHILLRRLNEGRERGRIDKIIFVQAG